MAWPNQDSRSMTFALPGVVRIAASAGVMVQRFGERLSADI
jgi:hypothetical protein